VSDIAEQLRAWLLTDNSLKALVGAQGVCQNVAPEDAHDPFVWFGRARTEHEDVIDQAAGVAPFRETFDVEAIGLDVDAVEDVAEVLRTKHCYRGTFGTGTVQGVFIRDHRDDYIPRGVLADDGSHVAALEFEIVGYAGA
jgi:hypothetical protein